MTKGTKQMATLRIFLVCLNVAGLTACWGGDGTTITSVSTNEFFVEDNGRRLATPQRASIRLSFHAPNQVEAGLSFEIFEQETSRFSLVARVPYELLRSREFEIDLVGRQLAEGEAAANMFIGGELITTGEMLIEIEEDERLSATFAERNLKFFGRFALSCFAPPESLNSGLSAPVSTDPGLPASQLIGDSLFKSPQCAEAKQMLNWGVMQ